MCALLYEQEIERVSVVITARDRKDMCCHRARNRERSVCCYRS